MTRPQRTDEMSDPSLARAIEALREPVPVREAWRASVLASLGGDASRDEPPVETTPRRRRVVLHPFTALAASLLFAIGGAVAGVTLARSPATPAPSGPLVDRSAIVADTRQNGAPVARFVVLAPGARQVALVGDFNLWNATATPMQPLADGRTWIVELPLEPGRHAYAFVVDGAVSVDPAAPRAAEDDFGRPNSVLVVSTPLS